MAQQYDKGVDKVPGNIQEGDASKLSDVTSGVTLDVANDPVKILNGFKKLDDGSYEVTMPEGLSINGIGALFNEIAKEQGFQNPVYAWTNEAFFEKNEVDPELRTIPGKTYRFRIEEDSRNMHREVQTHHFGDGIPLGVLAYAEMCEKFQSQGESSLLRDPESSHKILIVRGATPGVTIRSDRNGVLVSSVMADSSDNNVVFASSMED